MLNLLTVPQRLMVVKVLVQTLDVVDLGLMVEVVGVQVTLLRFLWVAVAVAGSVDCRYRDDG